MKTLVIDDERLARKELINLLDGYTEVEIIGECSNADEAIDMIKEKQPDLIFLDIQMPGKDGFEMLEELGSVPRVIFLTAFDEYAIKAFQVNALDYLLKPIDPERLSNAIDKLTSDHDTEEVESSGVVNNEILGLEDQIFLKDGDRCWFVTLEDVRMFISEGNYVRVMFNDQKPLVLRSLNNLEKRLDERTFFRANRKFIINLKWVDKIETWFNGGLMVMLKSGEQVEVSRRQSSKFKELLSL
mgnify:CR=1 FL=1